MRRTKSILRETIAASFEDGIPARGAALSFYVVLSLGPLLVLVVGALELLLQTEQVRAGIVRSARSSAGPRVAETVEIVLSRVEVPDLLSIPSLLSVALLFFGATAAFVNLRGSLNAIWGIEPEIQSPKQAALDLLQARARGFAMVLITGLVLAVSFAGTSFIGAFSGAIETRWAYGTAIAWTVDTTVSVMITGLLFGAIYRTLPALNVGWDMVWRGALATAVVFTLGKSLVAWLIGSVSWTSYFGPGASLVAFLAWIYFSAQLFFVGAEFTQVWSRHHDGLASQEPSERRRDAS